MAVDYIMIGRRIKEKRRQVGLTQEKLSEEIGVTVGYVSQCERGISKINLEKLSEVADVLNTDLSYFVTGSTPDGELYLKDDFCEKYKRLTPVQKKQILGFMDVMTATE